jgi:hypothetical protein
MKFLLLDLAFEILYFFLSSFCLCVLIIDLYHLFFNFVIFFLQHYLELKLNLVQFLLIGVIDDCDLRDLLLYNRFFSFQLILDFGLGGT